MSLFKIIPSLFADIKICEYYDYGIWMIQSGATIFYIEFRQNFTKETFSYDEHLTS